MFLNDEKLKALMKSGLRAVTVSLDGLKTSHNWLRGNAKSFDLAVSAIKLLPKTPHLKYDVVTCVNQRSFHELNSLKDFLVNEGITDWRIFTVFPIGRAAANPELQLNAGEF